MFKTFKIKDIFYKTSKPAKKKSDLSLDRNATYSLPLLSAKHGNNGIMYYGRRDDFDIYNNCIGIVSDGAAAAGDVYVYTQDIGLFYGAYIIKPIETTTSENILLYMQAALYKSIKPNFSYYVKASWDKVKNLSIVLPINDNGTIDYEYMEQFISETKQTIVAEYKNRIDKIIEILNNTAQH